MAGFFERLFDSNARELRAIENKVALVERYADEMAALSDEELKAKTPYFKERAVSYCIRATLLK